MRFAPLRQKVPWVASQTRGDMKTSDRAAGVCLREKVRLKAQKNRTQPTDIIDNIAHTRLT